MKKRIFIVALVLFGMGWNVNGQTKTPVVKQKQANQQNRIIRGVTDGTLTKKEVKQLERQQRNITRHKRHARSDGYVTRKERASIHAHQHAASRNIKRKKHNHEIRN